MSYDVLIAGGGVAGLTAALYTQRAGLTALVVERLFPGGQAASTYEIENYPGFASISGPELAGAFEQHARKFGAEILSAEITEAGLSGDTKTLVTSAGVYTGRALIIATGARPRLLEIPGERELTGRGVSYCATCDGAFYRGKTVAVIGGGNTAVEDAIFLSRLCAEVVLIHRRDAFRADRSLTARLDSIPNIRLMLNCVPESIQGEQFVTGLTVTDNPALAEGAQKTAGSQHLALDGVFVAVGTVPNHALVLDKLVLDGGYIVTDAHMATSVPGVFAAGDVRATPLRQVITAAADGAVAAYAASAYIAGLQ